MSVINFLPIAEHLEAAGLLWVPEIGDEVSQRDNRETISILVDPQGLTPKELRSTFIWLPTFEQLVDQFEARQAILLHLGMELSESQLVYRTIVKAGPSSIEASGESPREALGVALRDMLLGGGKGLH